MDEEFNIVYVDEPEWGTIVQGVRDYNKQKAGDDGAKSLCFVLNAPGQEIVGGVIGATYWDWFHIDLMWVKEELRGQGHGHRLLALAEDEARKRGAKNAYLDTYSFQAPDFYRKHGYQVFGELPNYPPGHQLYYLIDKIV